MYTTRDFFNKSKKEDKNKSEKDSNKYNVAGMLTKIK